MLVDNGEMVKSMNIPATTATITCALSVDASYGQLLSIHTPYSGLRACFGQC